MKRNLILFLFGFITMNVFAQTIHIKGIVTDNNGMLLPGVNVVVENTKIGTSTDLNGVYSIEVPNSDAQLNFSFIGYKLYKKKVKGKTNINVSLELDSKIFNEVVVVGFGSQKKVSVVGAISNISNAELKMAAPSNLTGAIAGRVTGALVRLGDGNIGGGDDRYNTDQSLDDAQIFIRGKGTTNSAQPLILIDGVEGSFSRINPEDIEQFSVLKDASATAVYGVQGANGVILITTKKGEEGKPKITFNTQMRMHQPLTFPHALGAYDYAVLYNEALKNMGQSAKYTDSDIEHWRLKDDPIGHADVDWNKELIKDHFFEEQHNINIQGGTKSVKYFVSGEYDHAGGPFKATPELDANYRRYNLRTNFDLNVTKFTTVSVKLNGRLEDKGESYHGESTGDRYYGTYWWDVLGTLGNVSPIYNPNGTFAYGSGATWNAKVDLVGGPYQTRYTNDLEANFSAIQKLDFIVKGLQLRGMYASNFSSGARQIVYNKPDLWSYDQGTGKYTLMATRTLPSHGKELLNYIRNSRWEFATNYETLIAMKHRLTAMAVYVQTESNINAALPVTYRGVSGRVTYDYKSTYLAEVNMGYNGSDHFAKGNRYMLFPAGSIGWVISQEPFMKYSKEVINFLKVRSSYGLSGNDKISSGQNYFYKYEFPTSPAYFFGDSYMSNTARIEGQWGNENVSWEITKKFNVGIDLKMFKSKLSITGDVFYDRREGILVQRGDLPTQTGLVPADLPAENLGKVNNSGYELSISYNNSIGDLGYTIGINYTFARSKILYIAELQKQYEYQMQKGHPVGQPFGYQWTGKFYDLDDLTNSDVPKPIGTVYPGDLMFEDVNHDGVISDYDTKAIGYSSIPEKVYGFNIGINYKDFYVQTFWQGASNVSTQFGPEMRYEFAPNVLPIHLDRWVYDPAKGIDTRATAKYPSLYIGGSALTKAESSFQLLNSEYLRLKTVEIGYSFPKNITKKMGVSNLKIFLSGSNLLTFDHIGYIDPEYRPDGRGNRYPQTKFYAVGLTTVF